MKILRKYGWRKLKGSNLTDDNLYTSIDLAKELWGRKFTLLGTMRKNRRGLAKEITKVVGRTDLSCQVWFESAEGHIAMISYCVKTKSKGLKNVVVLCTIPNLPTVGVTRDDLKSKPCPIKAYDFSKGGTDIVDQRVDVYTAAIKTRRWPVKMMGFILDLSRINSQSVYCLNKNLNPRKGVDSWEFG